MAAERIFFIGDWGHDGSASAAAHLPTAECSTAEHAIGRAFAQYVNRRVPIVSVGDTFYSKPGARDTDPVAWVAARLAAAEECLGPVATRERSWFFVPGNHDEESPLCGASLPQDFSLPEHAAPGRPPAAPGFDWASRYRGRWVEAGPGQAARAMARQDTWWARQLGGEGGGPRVLLIGIDTNCIVNAHVLALAAAQQQTGGGVDERLTKPLRHATAARCGYGSDEQAAVAERQAAWLDPAQGQEHRAGVDRVERDGAQEAAGRRLGQTVEAQGHLLEQAADRACEGSGVRSLQMTMFLRQQGVTNAKSMAGGIDLWAIDVEPGMRRY